MHMHACSSSGGGRRRLHPQPLTSHLSPLTPHPSPLTHAKVEMLVDSSTEVEQPSNSLTQLRLRTKTPANLTSGRGSRAGANVSSGQAAKAGGTAAVPWAASGTAAAQSSRVCLTFRQASVLDRWRGCLREFLGEASGIPWHGGALDKDFTEALARCRVSLLE